MYEGKNIGRVDKVSEYWSQELFYRIEKYIFLNHFKIFKLFFIRRFLFLY